MTDVEEKQERLNKAYWSVFNSDDGQLILEDLRRLSNYDLSVCPVGNDGHTDIYDVMRNEGKRAVVVHIIRKTQIKEKRQTITIN